MKLPRMPVSPKAWYDLVAREKWTGVLVPAQGGRDGGKRREYVPPPDVMALIEARQHCDMPPDRQETRVEAKARPEANSAALATFAGIATSSVDWLPPCMKDKDKVELAMKLHLVLQVLVGDDAGKVDYLLDRPDFMDRALKLIYELETRSGEVVNSNASPL